MPLSPIPFRHAGIAALLIAITINSVHAAPDADPVLTLAEGHLRLEARLRKMGIGADKPFSMPASIDTARQIKKATQGSERIARPGQVVGLVVRFRSPDVQALSARNAPPPDALVAQLNSVAGGELSYQRAMSMGFHVFRFATPKPLSEAGAILERLRALPEIEQVTEDLRTSRDLTPNDVAFPTQWNMQSVYTYGGAANLPAAWTMTTGSASTVVAVIDTGITAHPEFQSRILPGYDFISDPVNANDGNGRDSDASDPGDWTAKHECGYGEPAYTSSWHGTHVTGIIAAAGNNWSGMAGVNWRTRILPVRVLGKCGGSVSDIIDGMLWAVGLEVPGVPTNPNPAQVLNLSLGGWSPSGCTSAYEEALNRVRATGALVVAAAGNDDNESAYVVPAACEGVMTVGAIDHDGYRASYSNYSVVNAVSVSAPGGDISYYGTDGSGIYSTVNSGTKGPVASSYAYYQGTSMAAPHVSGIAALALAQDPQISPELLYYSIYLSSHDFPRDSICSSYAETYLLCGAGIADAYQTLLTVMGLQPYLLVTEYYNVDIRHYFRTGARSDSAFILAGNAGKGWRDTYDYFLAWRDASSGAQAVCRFYAKGPNSHFFTADAKECEDVKSYPGWVYEGIAYYMKVPKNSVCPSDSVPVHRLYNNRFIFNDSNHRFTTDMDVVTRMTQAGWIYEGVKMCGGGG
ncbi:S8 family peptidase [Zoogloea sp.]|uniref:S8 family peptidase n=2 Tax=Zoogloea sp. TaxID=49181 RepID=UPI0025FCAE31|nr:S8 family peptidase [Zoogloea sp.]